MKSLINSDKIKTDGFIRICNFDELKEQTGKRFIIDEVELAVFKLEGKVYTLSNICPHQHNTLIYDGFVEDEYVVCPAHGWMFNLKTGKTPSGTSGLDSYDVKIIDDNIYVKAYQKKQNW